MPADETRDPAASVPTEAPSAPAPPRKGAFLRDSASIAIGQYVARAMFLLRGWSAANALGPYGYGTLNALNLILDYGTYAGLGALEGLDLRLPGAVGTRDTSLAKRLMSGAWSFVLTGGLVFALGVVLFLLIAERPERILGTRLTLVMLVAVMLQLVFQYLTTSLRAHGRFGAVSAGRSTQALLGAGSGFVLVWTHGIWGLVLGWIAGTLVALVRMRAACPEAPLMPAHPRTGAQLAKIGFPIFAFFGASLVLRSVDRLAILRLGDAAQLGFYGVAVMAAGLVQFVPESLAYVLYPRVAAAHHGALDLARVRADVLRAQRGLSILMPFFVGLVFIWSGHVIAVLLPEYRAAAPAMRWLSAGALALSAATIPSYFLLGCGKEKSLLALGVLAAVANAVIVFTVTVYHPDITSVARAASAGYLLFAIVILMRAAAEFHATAAIRVSFTLVSLAPAIWGTLLSYGIVRFAPGGGFVQAGIGTVVFLVGYLPLAFVLARGLGMRTLMRETLAGR